MAWPPFPEASSSSAHICRRLDPHPVRHRRKQPPLSLSVLAPSSTLLSILASFVSASPAYANPTPLSFLCPSIPSDSNTPPWCSKSTPPLKRDDSLQQQDIGRPKRRRVPDKFMEGVDGIWRRVESYTLYGVTTPNSDCGGRNCSPAQPPSSSIGAPKNQTTSFIPVELPPGWRPASQTTNSRTTMILAVSLALSLFICFLIIVCLFWRNGLKKKRGFQDIEAKPQTQNQSQGRSIEEQRNIEVEKEAKAFQRIWARASARWKANARHSLRRRRGKRYLTTSHIHPTSSSGDDPHSRLTTHDTSRPPSAQSVTRDRASLGDEQLPNGPNPPSRPSSPPAYNTNHQIPPIIVSSSEDMANPSSEYSTLSHNSRRPSHHSLYSFTAHSHLPDTVHVATDDKSLLTQLSNLASAPPGETDMMFNSSLMRSSAPEDSDLEHVASIIPVPTDELPPVSLFPPPPSKERLAAAERLEFSFMYDNLENAEPEPEPSAPPFEEDSTTPPILFPSAPFEINDNDDVEPSTADLHR